jgi:hypothetical protein
VSLFESCCDSGGESSVSVCHQFDGVFMAQNYSHIDRRHLIATSILLPAANIPWPALALQIADAATGNEPPSEDGNADFANAWQLEQPGLVPVAGVPDVPETLVKELSRPRIASLSDLDRFVHSRTKSTFIRWFNQVVANRLEFKGKAINDEDAESNYRKFWSAYLIGRTVSPLVFFAYMSVFINERGGNLKSKTEGYGDKGAHPGISYLFDSVERKDAKGRIWRKKSYNVPSNWTAYRLFHDAAFISAHGALPGAEGLSNTRDLRWNGAVYPLDSITDSGQASVTMYIREADFFKFRGRGLIQTTWRGAYKKLVQEIRRYEGSSLLLRSYQRAWSSGSMDDICSRSTNFDWDSIFAEPSQFMICRAIDLHAADTNYNRLSADAGILNSGARTKGSVAYMGRCIGGSEQYGATLKARVRQLCLALS